MPRSALGGIGGAIAAAIALASPAVADAAKLCVNHAGCSAPADNFTDLQSAIDHAAVDSTPDVILVGPGTYHGPINDAAGNPITVTGAGQATVLDLTGAGDTRTTLTINEAASKFSSLSVAVPVGNGETGVFSVGALDRVVISDAGTSPTSSGLAMFGGTLDHTTVTMTSSTSIGVNQYGGRVRHSRISATALGMRAYGVLENSLVKLTQGGNDHVGVTTENTGSALRQVTLVGPGDANSRGVDTIGSAPPPGSHDTVNGAVIRSFGHALAARQGSYYCGIDPYTMGPMFCPGSSTINVSYSDFDPSRDVVDPGYGHINLGPGNRNVDPGFRNAAAGDYSLRRTSPVIDRGDPGAPFSGDSITDLVGARRKADGDGNGTARIDMGAFEVPAPRFGSQTLVKLDRAKKKITASGPLPIVVLNLNGFRVTGKLSGKTASKIPVGHHKKRRVDLGSKTFSVAGHRGVTVLFDLPQKVVKYFKHNGKLTVDLLARVRDPAGDLRTVRRTISVKLK